MKCLKCKKKQRIRGFDFCRNCFIKVIDRRVRKELKISKAIKKGDNLLIIDDGTCSAKLNILLIKKIAGKIAKIKVKKQSFNINKKINFKGKIIAPWNLDDEIRLFMKSFLNNKPFRYLGNYDNIIKPLACLKQDECELFAKLLGLKFRKDKKKDDLTEFIGKIENKYLGTRFSILKSSKHML